MAISGKTARITFLLIISFSIIIFAGCGGEFSQLQGLPGSENLPSAESSSAQETSQEAPLQETVPETAAIVEAVYGVDISSGSLSGTADPGSSYAYTITIKNTGNKADKYTLTTTGGALSAASLSLADGASQPVTLTISPPEGTAAGTSYNYDVTATSDNDASKTKKISTTTTVNTVYDVDLTPDTQSGNANPGATKTYTLTATNNGNAADVLLLSSADGVFNASSLNLGAGKSGTATFTITVPSDALAEQSYTRSAMVTSQNNATKTATAATETTIPPTLFLAGWDNSNLTLNGEGANKANAIVTDGKFNQGMFFTQTSQMEYNLTNSINNENGTIEFWFKPDASWKTNDVYSCSINRYFFSAYHASSNFIWLRCGNSGTGNPNIWFEMNGGVYAQINFNTIGSLTDSWNHLAITWNGTTGSTNAHMKIYLNGVQKVSGVVGRVMPDVPGSITIGNNPSYNSGASGAIDDFRIYGRARTASEIQQDYNRVVS